MSENKSVKKWVAKAFNPANKGALHKSLHVAANKDIPRGKLAKATHSSNPLLRKRAQLAETARNFKH